jgi:hypothetical protein
MYIGYLESKARDKIKIEPRKKLELEGIGCRIREPAPNPLCVPQYDPILSSKHGSFITRLLPSPQALPSVFELKMKIPLS